MAFSHSTALLKSQLLWCCDTSYQGPELNLRILNWCIVHRCKFVQHVQALGYPENKIYYEWTIDFGNFGKTDACQLVVCHRCGIQANINQKHVNFFTLRMNHEHDEQLMEKRGQTKNTCQPRETIMWNLLLVPEFSPNFCNTNLFVTAKWLLRKLHVSPFRALAFHSHSIPTQAVPSQRKQPPMMLHSEGPEVESDGRWCDVEIVEMWDIFKRHFTNTPVWKKLVLAKDAG